MHTSVEASILRSNQVIKKPKDHSKILLKTLNIYCEISSEHVKASVYNGCSLQWVTGENFKS